MTRDFVRRLLENVLQSTFSETFQNAGARDFTVTRAPAGCGEWTSNAAFVLGGDAQENALQIAQNLSDWPGRVEALRGRLNFWMSDEILKETLHQAVREGAHFGAGETLAGQKFLVEWVSSDPTGPLPFSAGRHAAVGEAICRLLENQGARVAREFYLNDSATASKIRLLGESVAAWYLETFGRDQTRPEGILDDPFVRGVAAELARSDGAKWLEVPEAERLAAASEAAQQAAIRAQRETLERFGVRFDAWVSETALKREGRLEKMLADLKNSGHVAQHDGALWLQSSQFGDETDRPLVRANGEPTYLAGDIAYHTWKAERPFERILNLWSAEHRPYIERTKIALQAAGLEVEKFEFLVCEGAVLKRDGTPLRLGKGGGPLILDEELENLDAATLKWNFLSQELPKIAEIDLETARRDDETNPAYAARLLPSRLARLRREAEAHAELEKGDFAPGERELARLVALWPDEAQTAAAERNPARVARFVAQMSAATRDLLVAGRPGEFQSGASASQRALLLRAAGVTAANALRTLGIEAPERF